ncbi:MAG: hypothetical protein MRZ66_04010 [Clostridiales bacterium]|nr:hypothetical protein [Clostridiales bacterium]
MSLLEANARMCNNLFVFGDINDIKKESDEIRNGTLNKINELERDIALIIAEYDDSIAESANIDKTKYVKGSRDESRLSDSVRMIKIRNM